MAALRRQQYRRTAAVVEHLISPDLLKRKSSVVSGSAKALTAENRPLTTGFSLPQYGQSCCHRKSTARKRGAFLNFEPGVRFIYDDM